MISPIGRIFRFKLEPRPPSYDYYVCKRISPNGQWLELEPTYDGVLGGNRDQEIPSVCARIAHLEFPIVTLTGLRSI